MTSNPQVIDFQAAMRLTSQESSKLYGRYVNHRLESLLKLASADITFARAEGIYLYDEAGRRYMDLTGGYGALNLGHNPAEVLGAVREAQILPAVLLVGHNQLAGALGSTLAAILPGDLSVTAFGNGGAEAVEIAMKTARASTGRKRFLSCTGAYHGLSFGALSVCGAERHRLAVGPFLDLCQSVPFGDLEALEHSLQGNDIAAFLVEPVQGEGGAVVPPDGYLKGAANLCRKFGTLLIFDEIQTGFGRTGRMFAMEHDGVVPDIVTLSKSLGSGVLPVSVSVTSEAIWRQAFDSRERFDLNISTFGGNPAACAAALKTIEIMLRDDIPKRARTMGAYAKDRLLELKARHKLIKDVRGKGLMLGIELDTSGLLSGVMDDNLAILVIGALLHEHRIVTAYYEFNPKVVRFEPPLTVTSEQIDEAVDALDKVLAKGKEQLAWSFGKATVEGLLRH